MSTYFKPLRRKIGVVALVISLTLMVCWLRSLLIIDSFQSDCFNSLTFLESRSGLIYLRRVTSASMEMKPEPIPVDALSAIVTDLSGALSPSVNYLKVFVESNRVVMKVRFLQGQGIDKATNFCTGPTYRFPTRLDLGQRSSMMPPDFVDLPAKVSWNSCDHQHSFRSIPFRLISHGQKHPAMMYDRSWVTPYWSIVIPLTMLSAWLLLSRPRAGRVSIESPPKQES